MARTFRDFMFDLKIFLRYIITRPFAELGAMFRMLYSGAGELDRPYFWVKFFGVMTGFLLVVGFNTKYWIPAYVAAGVMFIALLRFEWISGRFRKWHRDKLKERAKKVYEQTNGGR